MRFKCILKCERMYVHMNVCINMCIFDLAEVLSEQLKIIQLRLKLKNSVGKSDAFQLKKF